MSRWAPARYIFPEFCRVCEPTAVSSRRQRASGSGGAVVLVYGWLLSRKI
ncbi:unnamed protein product [Mycena citricolor]|uniref:Uncharacterized protein n=1 Tax=Mycena citricolor TaxID=2018698 RepID=A0AAD2Q3L8_9AGAR|nr:unnamed protein product [Mycena citricolor]